MPDTMKRVEAPELLADWREQSNEQLSHVLCRLPVGGPVPDKLQSELRFRFNTARGDLMSGDGGAIIHSPAHGADLILAIMALTDRTPSPEIAGLVSALEHYRRTFCEGHCDGYTLEICKVVDRSDDCSGCRAAIALATFRGETERG